VTVKVAAKTKLRIVARVFAPGGIILGEQQVEVPEGEAAVALAVSRPVASCSFCSDAIERPTESQRPISQYGIVSWR